ncbi:MAG: NAD-dependent epimerase/dehydratase family protein [Planctomycetes bacterium]|nr:NAD-dependent epimerase/dehydratase family protein [Planctomycetota bacterium]
MKVLVTGGNGFLGRAVVAELLARGHTVRSASRRPSPELDALGVRTLTCDLRNAEHVERAVQGQDAVVHSAALTRLSGARGDFVRTNVEGTRAVVAACKTHGVARLVHTSSPSVVFDGRNHRGADESLPYPRRYLAAYPETKALAEREVLAANGPRLATLALRPHLILGPGDAQVLPRLVARARAGELAIVGGGHNQISFTWIENAAVAHADALERLEPGASCAGRAYFVAQKEPVELWPWLAELFTQAGIPAPTKRISRASAYALGAACELAWKLARRAGEPPMTRFLALQLACDHSYSIAALERELGYRERVSTAEATARLVALLRGG